MLFFKNKKIESKRIAMLAVSIFLCLSAGFIGSFFTVPAIDSWYASLEKPWFNPPDWVFGPAWTFLYILIGVALYLVWSKGTEKKEVRIAMAVFGLQLFLNAFWSVIFFGMQNIFLALIAIIVLWTAILATILVFNKVSRKAALLLLPYLLWVSFATVLNYSVWILNI